jgi:hypothetical protein
MFERYTEKARRAIFFSRYEASQFGSSYIESEHLLLGIVREDKTTTARLLAIGAVASIHKRIEDQSLKGEKTATSVDLPLSKECQRALAYAAEEAERLQHKHIGCEHLLLGLLQEKKCFAALLLREHGLELEKARQILSEPTLERDSGENIVMIHGTAWDADYVVEVAEDCLRFFWEKQRFVAQDIAVHRGDGRITLNAGLADNSEGFDLVKGGWTTALCRICEWELRESEDPLRGLGYSNGRDWLCSECYEKFVAPKDHGSSKA